MRVGLVLLLGVAAWAPESIGAQDVDFESRLDPATLAAVQPVLAAASRDSLPLRALQSKILEGVVKNRPAAQIAEVVSGLADELRSARSALPGRALDQGEILAVAMASRQGVGLDVVQALWDSRPNGRSLEIPVTVLAELVRRGVPVDQASSLMTHVLGTAVPMRIAAQIPGKVDGAMLSGIPPGLALAEALRALNIPAPPGRRPNG